MAKDVVCAKCKTIFRVRGKIRTKAARFCSMDCRKNDPRLCLFCKKSFLVRGIQRKKTGKFCSHSCYGKAKKGISFTNSGSFKKGQPTRETHGFSQTRFYKTYGRIKKRCYNKRTKHFEHYGGRGIKMCERWQKFENFRDDMYESYLQHVKEFGEKDTTIDRVDNNGDYEPSNCRWATQKVQQNNRRNNRIHI